MNTRKLLKAIKRVSNLPKGRYLFYYTFNILKGFYLKSIKSTKIAHPTTIMLELTNHCNLACTTCPREYFFGKEMDKGRINVNEAKKIIDETWFYLNSLSLTGLGETFLSEDVEELVNYIKNKNKGIIISLSTNAVLPNFIDKVKKLTGKIDTIQVSIDGMNDIYEKIRQKSKFEVLDKNLRILSKLVENSDTDILLNMVVTKENYHHMPLLVNYSKELKIKYLYFSLFNLASVTDIDISYYDFYKSDEFIKNLVELEIAIKNSPEVNVTYHNFRTNNSFQKCRFPWNSFYVSWDGYVPPCCAKPFPKELNFGNVFKLGLMNTLNSNSYREFRTLWYENKPPAFCNKCHYLNNETPKPKLTEQ